MRYPVVVERSKDGLWCAYTLSPTVLTGLDNSGDSAMADLESATKLWVEFMKETQQQIPAVGIEVTSIEVAA